jgi:hypothetical protein
VIAALRPSWASEITSFYASQPPPCEVLEEIGPEHLSLGRADVEADNLALALGVDGYGDYRGDADDPPASRTLR